MVRSDAWRERPAVEAYWAFKDEVKLKANLKRFTLPDQFTVVFHFPMPASWSQKKRDRMRGTPHQQKPDIDNCLKAVADCLREDDAGIWDVTARKLWDDEGAIVIYTGEDR